MPQNLVPASLRDSADHKLWHSQPKYNRNTTKTVQNTGTRKAARMTQIKDMCMCVHAFIGILIFTYV